jgi:hypothetical protein
MRGPTITCLAATCCTIAALCLTSLAMAVQVNTNVRRLAAAGLPEEVCISSTALARGYAVLAVSSRDRAYSRCWAVPHHPDNPSTDVHSVRTPAGRSNVQLCRGACDAGTFARAAELWHTRCQRCLAPAKPFVK